MPTDEKLPTISENIPGKPDSVSAVGSANAPFIYTDWIGGHGIINGVVCISLEASRYMLVDEKVVRDRVVVGHLRLPRSTLEALKGAIAQIELLEKQAASEAKH